MKNILIAAMMLLLSGCCPLKMVDKTEEAEETPTKVTCYSGGQVIYDGETTESPYIHSESTMIAFEETGTRNRIAIKADCVIREY